MIFCFSAFAACIVYAIFASAGQEALAWFLVGVVAIAGRVWAGWDERVNGR